MSAGIPAIRASDAEREQTVEVLRRHSVEGRLTLEELAQRCKDAYVASTRAELEQLTRDLPEPGTSPPAQSRRRARGFTVSIFSGMERKGRWRVAATHWVFSIFGGSDLDLRQAELEGGQATIYVVDIFGGTDLYVPEGIEVDFHGVGIFGGANEHGLEPPPRPGAPLLRVVAISIFGGTDLWRVPAGAPGRRSALRRAAKSLERQD